MNNKLKNSYKLRKIAFSPCQSKLSNTQETISNKLTNISKMCSYKQNKRYFFLLSKLQFLELILTF